MSVAAARAAREQLERDQARERVSRAGAAHEAGKDLIGAVRTTLGMTSEGRRPIIGEQPRDEQGRFAGLDQGRRGEPLAPPTSAAERNANMNEMLRRAAGIATEEG